MVHLSAGLAKAQNMLLLSFAILVGIVKGSGTLFSERIFTVIGINGKRRSLQNCNLKMF